MSILMRRFNTLLTADSAQNMMEYCMLLGIIGVVAAFSCKPISNCLTTFFWTLYSQVASSFQ